MSAELDRLMEVMEASFDPHFREAWTRRQVEESLTLPSTFMLLIDANGNKTDGAREAAGFVLARRAVDEVELLLIAIRPEYRRAGLGSKLLDRFFDKSAGLGAKHVFLEVRADNKARELYRKAGFEVIGERPRYYRTMSGDHIDAITYGRSLSTACK